MKKTLNVTIGECCFIIDEDACEILDNYLERFKASLDNTQANNQVMDELETRIADQLKQKLGGREVVNVTMVQEVIWQLGYPQCYKAPADEEDSAAEHKRKDSCEEKPVRKLFRDTDDKKIAGVCAGLALFLGVDVVVIRILFLIALIMGSAGLWIYIVIWIAAPEAKTAAEKCEMRGIPATAENIRRFTENK